MSQEEQAITTTDDNYISPEVQALLDQAAATQAEAETTSIPFMSFKGKKFTLGEDKLGDKLDVVLLADCFDNAWYDRPYDPKSEDKFPPACFSIGGEFPHETSPAPVNDNCADCPKNQFGSRGNGKECRNGRRFLIASVGERGVNLANLAIMNIAPTTLKAASKYIKALNVVKGLPYWAVITKLSFDEDSQYPMLEFAVGDSLGGKDLEAISKSLESFKELIEQPYDTSNYEAPGDVVQETAKKSKVS